MSHSETEIMLKGYGLTTAELLYRMPDHSQILQSFIWQHYDLAPKFPELKAFLDFWERNLEGPLHSVRFVHRKLIRPNEWARVDGEIVLH
ncbi:Usg family protein [Limoniibacter endophyticus]|uniref:Usg family protein n=2 Tax=Limoniibacter endophyticus TaxID=1565040 RepID=A0A8J3GIR6_9HYPH|nr:Usg family protein [Limoniibacter endophyticus]